MIHMPGHMRNLNLDLPPDDYPYENNFDKNPYASARIYDTQTIQKSSPIDGHKFNVVSDFNKVGLKGNYRSV